MEKAKQKTATNHAKNKLMTIKEFLSAFLGKTLNLPADKVASLLNDEGTELKPEALDTLLAADATRVQAFKTENQTYFDNGVKKATKEVLTDFEKAVKEQYGITSDKKGTELIADLIAAKTNAGSLDESKVKLHPSYLALETKMAQAIAEKDKEWKGKYEGFEKQVAKEKTLASVFKKADVLLEGFALPENEKLRENQKTLLKIQLEKFGYQVNGEELIVTDADGKAVEDGHGNKKSFDAIVKEIAGEYWPVLDGTGRSGTGASNDSKGKGKAGTAFTGKVPANDAEWSQAIAGAKTAEERMALTDAYDAAQGGAK
jgi:hypothetical protein